MKKLCDVQKIEFWYNKNISGERKVLNDISFSIGKNEIVGILGKNGCGKSTLLNIISGFNIPQKGSVFIKEKSICKDGRQTKNFSIKERAKTISYIQQKTLTIPAYYQVEDFILEGRRPFRKFGLYNEGDYIMLGQTMRECNLNHFNNRFVNELSGGEQQRCIFARELMKGADLFLFDEPCSAMDIKYQKDFFNIAKNIKNKNGNSILITIHDINLAVQNCDRIILLDNGHILYDGLSKEIPCEALSQAFGVNVSMQNDNGSMYLYY